MSQKNNSINLPKKNNKKSINENYVPTQQKVPPMPPVKPPKK